MATMALPAVPQNTLLCREKSVGVRDSRPLGAGTDSSGCAGLRTSTERTCVYQLMKEVVCLSMMCELSREDSASASI